MTPNEFPKADFRAQTHQTLSLGRQFWALKWLPRAFWGSQNGRFDPFGVLLGLLFVSLELFWAHFGSPEVRDLIMGMWVQKITDSRVLLGIFGDNFGLILGPQKSAPK